MEVVHFAVSSPRLPPAASNPNVTTTRGTLPALPLHVSDPLAVQDFLAASTLPCDEPVMSTPPPRRRPRAQQSPATNGSLPRRSKRIARKVRVASPTTQAQNVLMRKWGITSESRAPDADALQEYFQTFSATLSTGHRKAIRSLFKGAIEAVPTMVDDEDC